MQRARGLQTYWRREELAAVHTASLTRFREEQGFRDNDHSSAKVIGARYVGHEFYEIRPVTLDSDPVTFIEDFRGLARDLAQEALREMKLL
jgi:hypothetical protein